jgi:glycine/D-amino acid oxidase-like deaminating enzyme
VLSLDPHWQLQTPKGRLVADTVIVATNGYSSEDLPPWLRARYLPVQSSVIVTRVLTETEKAAAGWFTDQMAYDSRQLLHYFRLLPEGRFLFGMRGGLRATKGAQMRIARKIRRDCARLFPARRNVELTPSWDGLVCMMPGLMPFVGAVPGHSGLYAALGYHGNGVAMGSYSGHLIGRHILGKDKAPEVLRKPPGRFPLGRTRRMLLAPAYLTAETLDL